MGALVGGGLVTLGSATLSSTGNNGTFSGAISGTGGLHQGRRRHSDVHGLQQQLCRGHHDPRPANRRLPGERRIEQRHRRFSSSASSSLVFLGSMLRYTGGHGHDRSRPHIAEHGSDRCQVNSGTVLTFAGTVTGAGQLQKYGAGTLVLTGNNNNTGGVYVDTGILRAGSATAFGTGGFSLVNRAGAVLDLNGFNMSTSMLSGGGSAGGNIQLGSGTLTLTGGPLARPGPDCRHRRPRSRRCKARKVILDGRSSNYLGGTTVSGGVLQVRCLTNGGASSSDRRVEQRGRQSRHRQLHFHLCRHRQQHRPADDHRRHGPDSSAGTGAPDFTNSGALVFADSNTAQTIRLGGSNTDDNRFGLRIDNNGAGVTSFTKQDAGTWILTTSGSGYTGVTQILSGVAGRR